MIATGSEVEIALEAVQGAHAAQGKRVRLVSMPCTERFDAQDAAYRESVLPAAVRARVAIEAGTTGLWWRYVGSWRPRDRHRSLRCIGQGARTVSRSSASRPSMCCKSNSAIR